jgi:hypothetical protein
MVECVLPGSTSREHQIEPVAVTTARGCTKRKDELRDEQVTLVPGDDRRSARL